ncbi:protein ERGIC-53-like [Suncus etruscus]|uniref:protein ERGIC-53-like n=1 Tax=Suncus etruscus TaxID=109475 RepID=UPI00210FD436|nr:protein ERGIC-53-like [Suncus etruscus]
MPLGVGGPEPLICLLLLLILMPHSREEGLPPHRRFEYKFSFKGPQLASPSAGIPFWSHHGDAIPGLEEVRLAPSLRNRSGAVWSRAPAFFSAWEVEVQVRITGPGRKGARGMAVWYTQDRGSRSTMLGGPASPDGIGILFDSSAGDPLVSGVPLPGPCSLCSGPSSEPVPNAHREAAPKVLGSCHRDFRNRPYPFRVRITYWGQRLRVSLNSGLTPSDPEEVCTNVGPLLLAPGGFFGVSAATSILADDHDVLSFLTFSLSEWGPEISPQPFLEEEQIRLEKQLEGLRARLALGTKEDLSPELNFQGQEGGEEQSFNLEDTIRRHSQVLQALQTLSQQLGQAGREWKRLLGSSGQGVWDFAKVSALLQGQQNLLQALRETRDAAAQMVSRVQVSYLPVGTKHHFLELTQTLSHLQKDLRGQVKAATKDTRPPGRLSGTSPCLRPGSFLFFLIIQTMGFFCYVHFRQDLDKNLREYLSSGRLPLSPAPPFPKSLGVLRRQPLPRSEHA